MLDTWFSSALWPFSTLGWPDETPELEALLSDQRAGHRLRHHLLLGRPHDDDGPAFHEGSAVPRRLHPRAWCATRRAPRCRSRRATSSIRSASSTNTAPTRCASRWRAMAAQGHDIRLGAAARREQPQLRDQAVERRALRRDERLRARSRASIRSRRRRRSTAGSRTRPRRPRAEITRGDRGLQVQRSGGRGLSLRLERLLRLVSRTLQAAADRAGRRGQGRDARHGRLGARRNPEAAASVHAVHHRGTVGGHGRAGAKRDAPARARRHGRSSKASTTTRPKPRSAG